MKITFNYYLHESARIKGFDYDALDRLSRLIIIVVLGPVYLIGKYILKKEVINEQQQKSEKAKDRKDAPDQKAKKRT